MSFAVMSTHYQVPWITSDVVVQQAGMDAGSVSSALLQLELMGLVSQLPGMQYRRC